MARRSCTLFFLVVALCACQRGTSDSERIVFPTNTSPATQTPIYVPITTTPVFTYTPIVIEVTSTPEPDGYLCVTASEAVYLRPSPSVDNYPITPLPLGAKLRDFGGREDNDDGSWAFVQFGSRRGWVNSSYVQICE